MENNNKQSNREFEDIVSDTHKVKGASADDLMYFNVFSNSKHYKKNRRGIKKLLVIGDWWRDRKKWQKAVMISALCCLLIIGILATIVLTVFDYNYNEITENPEDLGFENVIDKKIMNVALFGIDTRDKNSFKGLSDSIMILSINTKTKQVKIISVMRDSLVPITYNGKTNYAKINSAYQKGGPELAVKTINTIFSLDISEYATVNFFGMADIIEAVGGIDAELTKPEVTQDFGINTCIVEICRELELDAQRYFINTPGKHHLNGIQAVAYSRIRHQRNIWGTTDDYGRTDRQRYVMEQLFNKALTLDKTKYVGLAKALIPCAETSLSYKEIMGLATTVLLHSPTFEQTRVPLVEYQMGSKSVPGAGSCVYYDLDYASKIIHAFIYEGISPEQYMEQNGIDKNDWYKGSTNKPSSQSGNTSSTVSGGTVSSVPEDSSSDGDNDSSNTSSAESGGNESGSETGGDKPDSGGGDSGDQDTPTGPDSGGNEE